jgi:hypothetical protein
MDSSDSWILEVWRADISALFTVRPPNLWPGKKNSGLQVQAREIGNQMGQEISPNGRSRLPNPN